MAQGLAMGKLLQPRLLLARQLKGWRLGTWQFLSSFHTVERSFSTGISPFYHFRQLVYQFCQAVLVFPCEYDTISLELSVK